MNQQMENQNRQPNSQNGTTGNTGKKKHTVRNIIIVIAIVLALIMILFTVLFFFLVKLFADTGEIRETEETVQTSLVESAKESLQDGLQGNQDGEKPAYENDSGDWGTYGSDLQISNLREHYIDTARAESAVMMVYMIGSNLESESGAASDDLYEMVNADLGEDLQVVVETGGASMWMNDVVSADANQRFEISDGDLIYLEDAGDASMTETETLSDFINWTVDQYPADRYMLVLWDHGGGTIGGFGWDEIYDDDSFSLETLAAAIEVTDVQFDMIGFDACLMATVETAYTLEPYADYLIASEELEPGDGWYYTDFLTSLGEDVSMDTISLGKQIIDDYGAFYDNEEVTLSLIELREIPYVYEQLGIFLDSAQEMIEEDNSNFAMVSMARSKAREYNDCESEQVDIRDLVRRTDSMSGQEELLAAIDSCVKYRNNSTLTGSYGLAMYFPYREISIYSDTSEMLSDIDYEVPLSFFDYFLSIMVGGQQGSDYSAPLQEEEEDYFTQSWLEDIWESFDYEEDYEELYLEETADGFLLDLSDEEWDQITDIQLALMMEYEDGYLDLGTDNVVYFDEEGDAIIDFDGTWISIEGIPIAFFADKMYENEKGVIFSGTAPALLNDDILIDLVLEWEPLTDEIAELEEYELQGYVKGYRIVEPQMLTQEKGLRTLESGDVITLLYDYYDEDVYYEDTLAGDEIVVNTQDALEVSYADISDSNVMFWGVLYDIYQQELYTETLIYSD